jgi:NADPH-dependent glutamate synthase beta subunit-like oxidoreductase
VVAVIGGACAGSVVAEALAEAGTRVVVFEQNARPYGKIEDGLPRWHEKQRQQEYERIDARLDRPEVEYVPETRLGRDLDFVDVATAWGFSLVVLANGAWKDRPLGCPSADEALGRGLAYQNPFVYWFNHKEERGYDGPRFEIADEAVVVGGGLASIDVVKILQLEMYAAAMRARGLSPDIVAMEHAGIPRYLAKHGITDPASLGIKGCVLLYRRRVGDMPLAMLDANADEAQKARLPGIREKILANAQAKFLFRVETQRVLREVLSTDGRVSGVKVQKTEIGAGGQAVPVAGSEYVMPTRFVVSSIGSIPEPLPGVEMDGVYYRFRDGDLGEYAALPDVFAAGNVVTGQGNIKASMEHGQLVANHLVERYLRVVEADGLSPYARHGEATGALAAEGALQRLSGKEPLPPARIEAILERVRERQRAVGYDGDYRAWIRRHTPTQ